MSDERDEKLLQSIRKRGLNITFCGVLLKGLQADVDRVAGRKVSLFKEGSTARLIQHDWEFTFTARVGDKVFRWEGEADNAYDARYKGFCAWLKSRGTEGY